MISPDWQSEAERRIAEILPADARRPSATYTVEPDGSILACVTWKNRDADWDGEWVVVTRGVARPAAQPNQKAA